MGIPRRIRISLNGGDSMSAEFMVNEKLFPKFKEVVNTKDAKKLWLKYGSEGIIVVINDTNSVLIPFKEPEPEEKPESAPEPAAPTKPETPESPPT